MTIRRILARPERLELPTYWFEASRSIHLSYGRAESPTCRKQRLEIMDRLEDSSSASDDRIIPEIGHPRTLKRSEGARHQSATAVGFLAWVPAGSAGALGGIDSTANVGYQALSDWATPLATINICPGHFSEDEYCRGPLDNCRTYPAYHPDQGIGKYSRTGSRFILPHSLPAQRCGGRPHGACCAIQQRIGRQTGVIRVSERPG